MKSTIFLMIIACVFLNVNKKPEIYMQILNKRNHMNSIDNNRFDFIEIKIPASCIAIKPLDQKLINYFLFRQ